jgi:phage-related protein
MSTIPATYNRDDNVEGVIQPYSFVPEYGSTISFKNESPIITFGDSYYKKLTRNLNTNTRSFKLKFSNRTEEEAKSILSFLEKAALNNENKISFNSKNQDQVELSFPTGDIYKNVNDIFISDYDFNFHNGLFDIDLNLYQDSHSSFLDWRGSSYLNTGHVKENWSVGTTYEKFDVIYYPEYDSLPANNYAVRHADRSEKFYYCQSGHIATSENNPNKVDSPWTRNFFYDLDDNISISTKQSNHIYKLKFAFSEYNKGNYNNNLLRDLNISLKNRSNEETRSIIHFLEKHENFRPFQLQIPQLYTKDKFFVVTSLDHKFVYKNCNDIDVTINEVVRFKTDTLLDNFSYVN